MKNITSLLLAILVCNLPGLVLAENPAGENPAVINKVRFYPAPGHEQDMVGGKLLGSSISKTEGFELLGEIKDKPTAGQWTELTFPNTKAYRWLKYEAPQGSHGSITKLEFYSGDRKLKGQGFGSFPCFWRRVLDEKPIIPNDAWFRSESADGVYIGVDLGDAATSPKPGISPGSGEFKDPIVVTLTSKVPGAVIRYTTDGTKPTRDNGQVYSEPIHIAKTTTICAALFEEGKAPTPPIDATYIIGKATDQYTFHLGNSLLGASGFYPRQVSTAGYRNFRQCYALGACITKALWNAAMEKIGDPADKERWTDLYTTRFGPIVNYQLADIQNCRDWWDKNWPQITRIDDFTLTAWDYDIPEEADYENRFLNLILQKSPNVQPWIYVAYTFRQRQRPPDLGKVPSAQMKTIWPAATWEESMAATILYGEDLKRKVNETYKGAKPIRIIPGGLAMGWIHHMIENGEVPGVAKGDFYPWLFEDDIHVNWEGGYLISCVWYAAFHGESPEGKYLPILTDLTPKQAQIMQRLAWDVVKNYPASGYYEAGTTPCAKPEISAVTDPIKETAPVTLSSATSGVWFRYTLDGTPPTRTNGYVYCGVISVRPGMTVKAIAYKSGMADSSISVKTYPGTLTPPSSP